jgi:acyl dehydratase
MNSCWPSGPPAIGQIAELSRAVAPDDIERFTQISGDRNPLHSDPAFAARAGFERPILHGLCTYGMTGRALLACCADGDVRRFRAMSGRFSAPVLPGDELTVRMWVEPEEGDGRTVLFQTLRGDGTVVLDRGTAEVASSG